MLKESIEVHDELNPKLWENNDLKPEVAQKLNEIADEFLKYIEIPLNIVDIEIVGSNASYNYNENSDIDLHIIVNSEVNFVDPEILRMLYNSKKNSFNDNYDLSVEGIPVELYIEDVKDGNATNGRYSLSGGNWVLEPTPITYEIPDISQTLQEYEAKCNEVLTSNNPQDILDLVNDIYMMRKLSLATDGEAGVGNLVFKELRNQNMIPQLKDRYYELRSQELSESLNEAKQKMTTSDKIDKLLAHCNQYGLDNKHMIQMLKLMQQVLKDGSYTGKYDLQKEYDEWSKFYFYEFEEFEENKKIKNEASLSRLYQHTKGKDCFAVIGSQDKDTGKSRFSELKSLVAKLRDKISNIGYNYLKGTYTYDNGETSDEDSLIVYNIPKQDAIEIGEKLNQESIIYQDEDFFGFINLDDKSEDNSFDKRDLTFDDKITNMFGSRLRSGNTYKPAFAFECKLIETDVKGSTFSKQRKANIVEYPICKIDIKK